MYSILREIPLKKQKYIYCEIIKCKINRDFLRTFAIFFINKHKQGYFCIFSSIRVNILKRLKEYGDHTLLLRIFAWGVPPSLFPLLQNVNCFPTLLQLLICRCKLQCLQYCLIGLEFGRRKLGISLVGLLRHQ